jgi:hypothetical protein
MEFQWWETKRNEPEVKVRICRRYLEKAQRATSGKLRAPFLFLKKLFGLLYNGDVLNGSHHANWSAGLIKRNCSLTMNEAH